MMVCSDDAYAITPRFDPSLITHKLLSPRLIIIYVVLRTEMTYVHSFLQQSQLQYWNSIWKVYLAGFVNFIFYIS